MSIANLGAKVLKEIFTEGLDETTEALGKSAVRNVDTKKADSVESIAIKSNKSQPSWWTASEGVSEEIIPSNASNTQRSNTVATYKKVPALFTNTTKDVKRLDFGAGLGLGGDVMKADTYEPFAKGWNPDFSKPSQIADESYDQITSLNVLNVVPRETRDTIIKDIGRILKPEGEAIIGVRGHIDVFGNKEKPAIGIRGSEPHSIKLSGGTYQKGFERSELLEYTKETLGDNFEVILLPSKDNITKAAVKVIKKTNNNLIQKPIKKPPEVPKNLKTFTKDGYYTDKKTGEPKKLFHGMSGYFGVDQPDGSELSGLKYGGGQLFKGVNLKVTDGTLGEGVYLATDPKTASNFAMSIRAGETVPKSGGQVFPVFVKTKYIFDSDIINNNNNWRNWLKSLFDNYKHPYKDFDLSQPYFKKSTLNKDGNLNFEDYRVANSLGDSNDAVTNPPPVLIHLKKIYKDLIDKKDINLGDLFSFKHNKKENFTHSISFGKFVREQIGRQKDFGGITIKSDKGFEETVIFNPNDIKSSLQGPKGAYDPDNPDMLLNTGGLVQRPNR